MEGFTATKSATKTVIYTYISNFYPGEPLSKAHMYTLFKHNIHLNAKAQHSDRVYVHDICDKLYLSHIYHDHYTFHCLLLPGLSKSLKTKPVSIFTSQIF